MNKKKGSVSQNGTANQKLEFKKQKFRKWALNWAQVVTKVQIYGTDLHLFQKLKKECWVSGVAGIFFWLDGFFKKISTLLMSVICHLKFLSLENL